MNKTNRRRSKPRKIVFIGERVMKDRAFPLSLSPEDCRHLVDAMLTDEQKARLEKEHSLSFEVPLAGRRARGRVFATSHDGAVCALITASC